MQRGHIHVAAYHANLIYNAGEGTAEDLCGLIRDLKERVRERFGVALFITELCPSWLKRPLSMMIELLAAIPSIIYGIWGLFVLAPFVQEHIEPALIDTLGTVPGIGLLFQGPPLGIGVLTAGFIIAIMVLPFISAVMKGSTMIARINPAVS